MIKDFAKILFVILFIIPGRGFCASSVDAIENRMNAIRQRVYPQTGGSRSRNASNSRQNSRRAISPSRAVPSLKYKVKVYLANKRIITGEIALAGNSIIIPYRREGIDYIKNLKFSNIRSVEVAEFGMSKISKAEEYIVYYFFVKKFKIIDKKGNIFYYNGRVTQFNLFKLTNNYGSVKLKTSFYDYWNVKKKKWYNGNTFDFNALKFSGTGKTVIKIIFI